MASLASLIQSLMESFDGGETYVEVYGWFCVGFRDHRIAGCAGKRATFGSWLLENGRNWNDQRGQHHYRPDKESSRPNVFLQVCCRRQLHIPWLHGIDYVRLHNVSFSR